MWFKNLFRYLPISKTITTRGIFTVISNVFARLKKIKSFETHYFVSRVLWTINVI